ncbi:hypothetical protein [Thermus sp.]
MGKGGSREELREEAPRWEAGRPGRPPASLRLLGLDLEGFLDEPLFGELGLRRQKVLRQGLLLLRLAQEAHRLGAELRWGTADALKGSLLDFLRDDGNAGKLLAALSGRERALLGLSAASDPGKALKRAVQELHVRYHPRDLIRGLLRRLRPFFASLAFPDAPLPRGTPEAWAAAAPLAGAFRGLFALLEDSYQLPAGDFERAFAPCWVFAFLQGRGGVAEPFQGVPPHLELARKTQRLRYRRERTCLVARSESKGPGPGELYEKPSPSSERDRGPRIPSPSLGEFFPEWYRALEEAWGQAGCTKVPFPQGYDWDLVAEYRSALWAALVFPGKGGKA